MGRALFAFIALNILISITQLHEIHAADFEVTPILGYTFGGGFEDSVTGTNLDVDESESYGIILGFTPVSGTQYEFFYSHQPTRLVVDSGLFTSNPLFDLDIDYFHIGGIYGKEYGKLYPYASGGLGLTYMNPESGGDSETKFSLSVGGGTKIFLTDRIGIRLEGRALGTLFDGSGAVFCSNGRCAVHISGDMLWQFSMFSGLILAF